MPTTETEAVTGPLTPATPSTGGVRPVELRPDESGSAAPAQDELVEEELLVEEVSIDGMCGVY